MKIRKTGENDLRKETEGIATKKRQGITEGGNGKSLKTNSEFEMLSVNSQLKQQALKFKQISKEKEEMRAQYKKKGGGKQNNYEFTKTKAG